MAKKTSYYSLSDQDLAQLLVQGKEDAFTEIYQRFWEKLMAIAFNLTKDQVLSEEITQEVFISLWDRRHIVQIGSLGGYLATAIKFSVFKHLVRQRRQLQIIKDNFVPAESFANEEERVHARFLTEYVGGIVEQLPEKCRLVFRYSRYEGLSIAEIASRLDISPKTAEAHLTKALKTIRLNLRDATPLLLLLLDHKL